MQTPEAKNSDTARIGQGEFQRLIREKISLAARLMLISVLEGEAEEWVGARR